MINYVNLIPMLKPKLKGKNESLDSEQKMQLDEDKIPKDLYNAYMNSDWDPKYNLAAYKTSTYGKNNLTAQHDRDYKHTQNRRRSVKTWDFGKANYQKLTKQQTVDLLAMKIYEPYEETAPNGTVRKKYREITINDQIPENGDFKVTSTNESQAIENINKLRFLLPSDNDVPALVEYEYRPDKKQYFPVYRQPFSRSVLDKFNINYFKFNRIDYAPNSASLKGVYYAIKFADKIYETDEYEHYLNQHNIESVAQIQSYLESSLAIKYVINQCINLINRSSLTEDEKKEKIDNLSNTYENYYSIRGTKENFPELWDTNIDMNGIMGAVGHYIITLNTIIIPNQGHRSTTDLLNKLIEGINNKQITNSFNKYYKSDIERHLSNIFNNTNSYTKIAYEIQDNMLDNIENDRERELYKRIYVNTRNRSYKKYTPTAKLDNEDHEVLSKFLQGLTEIHKMNIADTGDHDERTGSDKYYIQYNMKESAKELINRYNTIFKNLHKFKNDYIHALNEYNKLKKEQDYYSDLDEYNSLLDDYKRKYDTCKEAYFQLLNSKKDIELDLSRVVDDMSTKIATHIEDYVRLLDLQHNRLFELRNQIKQISTYGEEELINIYGADGKAQFEKFQKMIDDLIQKQQKLEAEINTKRNKLEDLRQQVRQLESEIQNDEQLNSANAVEIARLQNEQSEIKDGIDLAIEKSYIEQKQFIDDVDDIKKNILSSSKLGSKSDKYKEIINNNKRTLELINSLKSDVINLGDEIPNEPSEDDILSYDDENNDVGATAQ